MATQNSLSHRLLTTLCLSFLLSTPAYPWSDPILVTPDSASSKHSRVVFDPEGNLHFFFVNNRYEETPPVEWYEVFHCKFSSYGDRLTEDLRLSYSFTYPAYPSPLLGSDGKIHVIWNDVVHGSATTEPGIYYARLDTSGSIEHEASLVFECSPLPPHLFEDSQGDLNVVWLNHDSLYFGKFDTSGQVLIQETFVYTLLPSGGMYNLEACMDGLNQIHCTYRNYYGTWNEWNLGYSRVNNYGDVLIEYASLTPEIPGIVCGRGGIVSDIDNNLHLSYLYDEYGTAYQHYRKFDQSLNTVYDIIVINQALSGSDVGLGDIALDGAGNVVIAFAYNYFGVDLQYKRVTYSIDGIEIIPPETIIDTEVLWPDLAVNSNGMAVFNYTWAVESLPGSKIFYSYEIDELPVETVKGEPSLPDVKLSVFPNPSNYKATFRLQCPKGGGVNVRITDPAGRILYDYGELFLQGTKDFMLEKQLPSGVYYLVVKTNQGRLVQPIIRLR